MTLDKYLLAECIMEASDLNYRINNALFQLLMLYLHDIVR